MVEETSFIDVFKCNWKFKWDVKYGTLALI